MLKNSELRGIAIFSLIVAIISGAVSGGLVSYFSWRNTGGAWQVVAVPQAGGGTKQIALPKDTEDDVTIAAVERITPSVVSIVISKNLPIYTQANSPFNGFFDFVFPFGPQQMPMLRPEQNGPTQKQDIGGGTGFFVSASGYILTNRHVVSDAQADYTVITADGKKLPAKVIDRDQLSDLAVVKVEGSNFPVATLGDSGNVRIGQAVIAVGYSLAEYQNTVTKGVVSGINRRIQAGDAINGQSEIIDGAMQTDAAINPGNSGGPLVNLHGEVIGINTAINAGGQLLGFAIPINAAKQVVESVIANGHIIRPYVGVRYVLVTQDIQDANSLGVDHGAFIVSNGPTEPGVLPKSPAAKAGLKSGDVIIEADGVSIDANHSLGAIIADHKVGDIVVLKVFRDGNTINLHVKLEMLPAADKS